MISLETPFQINVHTCALKLRSRLRNEKKIPRFIDFIRFDINSFIKNTPSGTEILEFHLGLCK